MTLTRAELAELEALERYVEATTFDPLERYCPHTPTPRQRAFLDLDCLEALYGGAAGGGKSDALLMAALQYVHVPGYSALLLRRTFPELKGDDGLIERASEWLSGTDARWIASELCWVFPNGASLRFGHMQHETDKTRYQGHALQFVGYDELTHFLETQWAYLLTRIRRPKEGPLSRVPLRLRGGTNPGGIGHEWVRKRFGIAVDGVQRREDAMNAETEEVREFVPALLADNPHLDQEAYRRGFTGVDSVTRDQLERGRWVRDGQGLIYRFEPSRNLIALAEAERLLTLPGWHFILAMDLGASQAKPTTAFVLMAWSDIDPRVLVLRSWAEAGLIPSDDADRIAKVREERDLDWVVLDEGALGKGYGGEFRARFGEALIQGAKKTDKLGHRRLMNGALERGHLLIVEEQNDDLVEELQTLPWNADGTDAERGFADHLTDALLYGWRSSLGFAAEPPANEPAPGTPEWGRLEEQRMEQATRNTCRTDSEASWLETDASPGWESEPAWYELG